MRNSIVLLLVITICLTLVSYAGAQTKVMIDPPNYYPSSGGFMSPYHDGDGTHYPVFTSSPDGEIDYIDTTYHYDIRNVTAWWGGVDLDADTGYTLRFDVHILEEYHAARDDNGDGVYDRAGFSIINISNDGRRGLEIGFWEDEIWMYQGGGVPGAGNAANYANGLFCHGEGVSRDLTTGITRFDVAIKDGWYALYINDSETWSLRGTLKDYTAWDGGTDPYETANSVWMGDNTTSGSSNIGISYLAITPLTKPVPEPATMSLLALGGLALIRRRKRSL